MVGIEMSGSETMDSNSSGLWISSAQRALEKLQK